jgi:TonB family protein
MKISTHHWTFLIAVVAAVLFVTGTYSQAQESGKRRLLSHDAPSYPELARSAALEGVVKVDALVAADGTVKSAEVKGGHPVLAQAALTAVRHWKWEAAPRESHEIVEVKFSPE